MDVFGETAKLAYSRTSAKLHVGVACRCCVENVQSVEVLTRGGASVIKHVGRTHAVVVQLAVYCDSQQSAHASSNHQSIRPNATYSRHIGCISASAAAAELVVDVCGNVIDTARLSASTNNTNPSSFINTSSSSSCCCWSAVCVFQPHNDRALFPRSLPVCRILHATFHRFTLAVSA